MRNVNLDKYNEIKRNIQGFREIVAAEMGFFNSNMDVEYHQKQLAEERKMEEFLDSLSMQEIVEVENFIESCVKELQDEIDYIKVEFEGPKNFFKRIFNRKEVKSNKSAINSILEQMNELDEDHTVFQVKWNEKHDKANKTPKPPKGNEAEQSAGVEPNQ